MAKHFQLADVIDAGTDLLLVEWRNSFRFGTR